jgi:hypothetical protein
MKNLLLVLCLLVATPVWAQQRVNTELPDGAALADNTATPTAPATGAFLMCWDTSGSNWDRCGISTDWTVSSPIGTAGPGTIMEAKDFDGGAFPQMSSPAELDAVPAAASLYGVGYNMLTNEDGSRSVDPCFIGTTSGGAKAYIPISVATGTTVELTPALAGASTHYYICSINLYTDAANDVLIADDDSDGCGSPSQGIFGSDASPAAAEGWNLAAGGSITIGSGSGSIGRTSATNRVLCIITSAATQLSGNIVVVPAP